MSFDRIVVVEAGAGLAYASVQGEAVEAVHLAGGEDLADWISAWAEAGILVCVAGARGAGDIARALRRVVPSRVALWPEEPWETARVVVAAVDPAMLEAESHAAASDEAPDVLRLRLLVQALGALAGTGDLAALLRDPASLAPGRTILGAGHETRLRAAVPSTLAAPRLRNDCFALPRGVDWVPVDEALAQLAGALVPITGTERLPTAQAAGRVLAADCVARRSNPAARNSAVDGYGFAQAATGPGPQRLPLLPGRAAAGAPFPGPVPAGAAVRILTGAILPEGVDTVVLDEDTATDGAAVVFEGPVRRGSNTRRAGEDMAEGDLALRAGQWIRPQDIALMTALGIAEVAVRRKLRVGVLSTGDELVADPAAEAAPHQVFDANRPMLLALAGRWGCTPVDLGHVPDAGDAIAERLDAGARAADVIFTSGGASAGDEDHVSRLLRAQGTLSSWRIAIKPGRPLALALWQGTPVFGLPGNPVAAFVCALIFARPALSLMAGAGWTEPQGFTVPAAFEKSKKPGRREYLRARLTPGGAAEVFRSEGSGRISGLSWATGLVELPDHAVEITPGMPVTFLPYASFGL